MGTVIGDGQWGRWGYIFVVGFFADAAADCGENKFGYRIQRSSRYSYFKVLLLFTNIVNHIRIACGSKTVTLRKLRNIYYKSCFKIPAKTPVTEPILLNLIRDLY